MRPDTTRAAPSDPSRPLLLRLATRNSRGVLVAQTEESSRNLIWTYLMYIDDYDYCPTAVCRVTGVGRRVFPLLGL